LRISSSAPLSCGIGLPNRVTSPATGRSSPVSAASRVDLPLPDGPSTAVMLPGHLQRHVAQDRAPAPVDADVG
jgi:hypothetical protein